MVPELSGPDTSHVLSPRVLYHDHHFWIYYNSYASGVYPLGLAISRDGINFTKKGLVMVCGASGDTDDYNVYTGCQVFMRHGYFHMLYAANDGTSYRNHVAISKDGINFTRKGHTGLSAAGDSDGSHAYYPTGIFIDHKFSFYYPGNNGSQVMPILRTMDEFIV